MTPTPHHRLILRFTPRATAPWLMAASLALGGCASLTSPDAAPPAAAVPTAWSSEARPAAPVQTPTDLAQWWQRFNDPLLSALVAQALQANTDVLSAQAALRQARAQREASAAGLYPNLGASAGGQRNTTGGNLASNSYSTSLDASWEPDVFGATRSGVKAADAEVRAATASLASVQVSMAAEVAVTYYRGCAACRPGWRLRAATWTALNENAADHALARAGRPDHIA
jgi:multidrug efflux system outer membrane protein